MITKIKQILKQNFSSLAFFYRYLRHRLVIMLLVSILIGVMDGLGLAMFIPLLESVAGDADTKANMGNLAFIVEGVESLGLQLTLTVTLLTMLFFFIMKGAAKYLEGYLSAVYQQYFTREIRMDNINALTHYDYEAFVMSDAGRIQNTLSGEVQRVVMAYLKYSRMLQNAMLVLAYLLMAFLANPEFALLVAVGGGLTNFVFNRLYKKTKVYSGSLVLSNNRFQGLLIQMVAFFKYLKATGSINGYSQYLKDKVKEIEATQRKMGILDAIMSGLREPLIVAVVVLVILLQVQVLGGALGAILLSLVLFYRALTSMMSVQAEYNKFLGFSGSLHHMDAFTEELKQNKERKQRTPFTGFRDKIEVRGLSFAYQETAVIQDLDLTIHKNETLAFVGESGSGKTTMMNILAGLLKPQEGKVLVDGKDLFSYDLNSYRNRIGYITQEPVIFDDTVFNNVTFWTKKTEENLQRFHEALQKANIYDLVESLPEKEDAPLGNNGVNLSGGQKQRISIARELYKEVEFLFMDEATSALDSETEKMIQDNIDQLKGKYTILIIAHRLSTIKNADRVVVMSEGYIEKMGTYTELIERSAAFKRMVELQEL